MSPRLHLHFRRRPSLWSWWLEADINWTLCCNASFLNYITTLELFFHGNIQLCHAVQHVLMRRVALFVGNFRSSSIQKKKKNPWSGSCAVYWAVICAWSDSTVECLESTTWLQALWARRDLTIESFHFEKPHMMEFFLLGMRSVSKSTSFCLYELSPCTVLADHVQSFIQVRVWSAYAHIVRVECIFTNWYGA